MAPSRAATKPFRYCEGSPSWDPSTYVADTALQQRVAALLRDHDDLAGALTAAFSLPARDSYVYHAIVSVTLAQVQHVVGLGGANGLHAWYQSPEPPVADQQAEGEGTGDETKKPELPFQPCPPPTKADIETYLSIFAPTTLTPNILKSFLANAKKGSLRASIAGHLLNRRYLHPGLPQLQVPRTKTAPANPYLDFLSWACVNLEWAGPAPESEAVRSSHHVLPVFMHHFGCVCPSHEALSILGTVAAGREVLDVGSGNGYWTFMLRRYYGHAAVTPVDNAQSSWRANWVADTQAADGAAYLRGRGGAPDAVLLVVYPIVGGGVAGGAEGGFTRGLVRAFAGDTLAVVGTQNRNGYTGFRDATMDEYMAREEPAWTRVAQVPLPSFPGKDDALFVFQRGDRAPRNPAPADADAKAP